jgi:hypothetical protein
MKTYNEFFLFAADIEGVEAPIKAVLNNDTNERLII